MRVTYVVSLFPCWSETFIVREIRELLRRGVDVHIVSLKHPSERLVQADARELLDRVSYPPRFPASLLAVGRALVAAPLTQAASLLDAIRGLWSRPSSLLKTLVVWWRCLGLTGEVRLLAPEVIHAHWATYPSTAALFLSRALGIPFSFTAHAHDLFLEDHLLRAKLQEASFAVTISEFNSRLLRKRFGPLAEKVFLVHCGIPLDRFEYRSDGRKSGLVLAVGRLDEIKGFSVLVDSCRILATAGVAYRCLIVGEGPLKAHLEARAQGLEGRVELAGVLPMEEVRRLLYEASVFVLPSVVAPDGNMDGIPVALMEAMAAGTPVVSTRVSGIPELIEDGVSGSLVDPQDAAGLASRIGEILADPSSALLAASKARNTVQDRFDVSTETGKLLGLLETAARRAHA